MTAIIEFIKIIAVVWFCMIISLFAFGLLIGPPAWLWRWWRSVLARRGRQREG
jgi:hypothetical protein